MKITFLGNFYVDYTSESHYLRTLRKIGHEVFTFQEGRTDATQIREHALNSDIFFWVHTHGWDTPGIENLLAELKNKDIPSVGYHLDLWLGIERQKDLETDPYWGIQYFFSVDPEMVNLLNSRDGLPKAFFLPPGVVEDECYIAQPDREKYPHDIIFVGSKAYHPEWPYRPTLISWLQETYKDRFKLYGREEGRDYQQIRGHKLNVLYASAKIVIGDTLCPGFNKPEYLSDRIFETTGRGGFIIHPYISGLENHFVLALPHTKESDYEQYVELQAYNFNDFEQLREKIDFYLEMSDIRETMRILAHERTKNNHTYTHRLNKLIQTIQDDRNVSV